MTLLLSLAALGAVLLLARRLATVSRRYPPVPPRHSVPGPVYLGGSVRAALQIAPDRDTLYRAAAELAQVGAFDAAADLLIAASSLRREEGV